MNVNAAWLLRGTKKLRRVELHYASGGRLHLLNRNINHWYVYKNLLCIRQHRRKWNDPRINFTPNLSLRRSRHKRGSERRDFVLSLMQRPKSMNWEAAKLKLNMFRLKLEERILNRFVISNKRFTGAASVWTSFLIQPLPISFNLPVHFRPFLYTSKQSLMLFKDPTLEIKRSSFT